MVLNTIFDQPFNHVLNAGTTCSNLFFLQHLEAEDDKQWLFCKALVQAILLLCVQLILTPYIEELISTVTVLDWLLNEQI
jgi:hypothetical protein